jgi:DNA-binding CsgD family transcriptional regulator
MVTEYETAVAAAETPEAIWVAVSDYFRGTVVDRIIYLHLPPFGAPDEHRPALRAEGFPEELVTRYLAERLYWDNPVVRQSSERVAPVYWDEAAGSKGMSERERSFVEQTRREIRGNGVGVPVFGPNGRFGLCGLGFEPNVARLPPETLRQFQWVCQLGHLRYCKLLNEALGPPPSLSDREAEILAWVARGKSNSLIAEILGISVHTVDAHLRRIYVKLGVFDRITAAVRGIGIGLIRSVS